MGCRYNFHFSKRTHNGWIVPPAFIATSGDDPLFPERANFAWLRENFFTLFGQKGILPLRPAFPKELHSQFPDMSDDEFWGWLPFEELAVDLWDDYRVLLGSPIEAQFAPLFGDGLQPFPWDALSEVDSVISGKRGFGLFDDVYLVDEPIPRSFGKGRHEAERSPPLRHLDITFIATISEIIGEWRVAAFRGLRQYGREEELVVYCRYW